MGQSLAPSRAGLCPSRHSTCPEGGPAVPADRPAGHGCWLRLCDHRGRQGQALGRHSHSCVQAVGHAGTDVGLACVTGTARAWCVSRAEARVWRVSRAEAQAWHVSRARPEAEAARAGVWPAPHQGLCGQGSWRQGPSVNVPAPGRSRSPTCHAQRPPWNCRHEHEATKRLTRDGPSPKDGGAQVRPAALIKLQRGRNIFEYK